MRLKIISRGRDANGTLQTDVIVNGRVPTFSETSSLRVLPYVEQFVQSGAGASSVTMTTLHCQYTGCRCVQRHHDYTTLSLHWVQVRPASP